MNPAVAAIDLGATSGRVVVGELAGGRMSMRVVKRFPNVPIATANDLRWDIRRLFDASLSGLAQAVREGTEITSVGVDSWAVDYGRINDDELLDNPIHYRDERSTRGVAAVDAVLERTELYRRNGLQFLPFNTLYQLAAERIDGGLEEIDHILMIPDLLTNWLSGTIGCEATNASTTGLVNASSRVWDTELIRRLSLPESIFPELVLPGTLAGETLPHISESIGLSTPASVVSVGSHDTASAVVAVPMDPSSAAYISCGTWGLVGMELDQPILTEASQAANFTNEAGVDHTVRFLHNVMGLWLLSESTRHWEANGVTIHLDELLREAALVTCDVAVFDANDSRFFAPGDMPSRIDAYCREHDLAVPQSRAELVRSIIESLAAAFANAVHQSSTLTGRLVETIHMVGGGALNQLLCQRTADRAGTPVLAGPVEATAVGNLLVQARTTGLVHGSLDDLRQIVQRSTELVTYVPKPRSS